MSDFIYINNLSFTYDNNVEPLFDCVTFQLQKGWTGVVGANGSGKSTLLKLLTHQLNPDRLSLNLPHSTYYCEQRTDDRPSGFISFLESTEKRAFKIRENLDIKKNWENDLSLLSHGERKRSQIGVALYQNPSVVAVDEPSNHLDPQSKRILFSTLKSYRGIGLLVSHDRVLLDSLCTHTLFIDPPKIDLRNCSYTIAAFEREKENQSIIRSSRLAKQEVKKLKKRVHQQHLKAQQADNRVSKRKVAARDHDAKSKIDQARLSGKDAIAGKIKKRIQSQLIKSIERQKTIKFNKQTTIGISFNEKKLKKNFPLIIPPGKIELGPEKMLYFSELVLQYGDKIGIRGNNGSGKSTFLEYFLESGKISSDEIIYIPQEISIDKSKDMIKRIQNYNKETKGKIITLISRLGSDPKHMIETSLPSPGEVRKLLLAEGLMLNPGLK